MNKPLIGIVGSSGTGKSTSLRNLPLDKTIIIDLERKGFPFKEAKNFQVITATTLPDIDKAISTATKNADIVVIESFTKYCEILIDTAQKMYKGYSQTNSDGVTSAKTPLGMFKNLYIPNDLNTVINSLEEYYA